MSILALEINDAGLLARRDGERSGPAGPPSPGYALLDGESLVTGIEALVAARLKPTRVNNRFWSELDTSPLRRPFPGDISHADLAHRHLSGVWAEVGAGVDGVILAVPGSSTEHQLGLTLGIARACEIPVIGLVDAAVAASSNGYPGTHLLHLDVQLHRTVLTELTQGREVTRRRVEVSSHAGLVSLRDAWVKAVARSFVHHTRFDPLHLATTEQELHRRLDGLLERLCGTDSAVLALEAGGTAYSVEMSTRQLVETADAAYSGIVRLVGLLKRAGRPATVLLSHRAAGLPGLLTRLTAIGDAEVVALPADSAVLGALRHRDLIQSPGEALAFVTRLPGAAAAEPRRTEASPEPEPVLRSNIGTPTHVLHAGRAHRITSEPFVVGVAVARGTRGLELTGETAGISRMHCSVYRAERGVVVEDHSTHGSFLNGQRVEGRVEVEVGDRLRLGSPGIELQLIAVADEDGAPQH